MDGHHHQERRACGVNPQSHPLPPPPPSPPPASRRTRHCLDQLNVKAFAHAVVVDAIEQDLASSQVWGGRRRGGRGGSGDWCPGVPGGLLCQAHSGRTTAPCAPPPPPSPSTACASCTASTSRPSRPPLIVHCHQQNRSPLGPVDETWEWEGGWGDSATHALGWGGRSAPDELGGGSRPMHTPGLLVSTVKCGVS